MFRLVIAAYVDSRSESSGVGYAGAVAVGTGAQPVLVVVCFRMSRHCSFCSICV